MASSSLRVIGVLAVSAVSSLAVACGGGGLAFDDLPDEYASALCEWQVRCGVYASVADCRADLALQFEQLRRSYDAGRIAYDEGKASDCVDAIGAASCDVTQANVREEPAACRDALRGTVADGGTCYDDVECVSRECTVPDCGMACCAGVCGATLAEVAIGGTCNGTTGDCVAGSFCDAGTSTCTALRAAGGACTDNSQCAYGLYCPEAGTCAEAPNRGEPCPEQYCADIGDRCDAMTATCVGRGGLGDACSEGFAGLFDCMSPLTCNPSTLQCDNPPTAGQPCVFFCAAGNFCNLNDVCEATKANGQACDSDSECESRYCDDTAGMCADVPVCG